MTIFSIKGYDVTRSIIKIIAIIKENG